MVDSASAARAVGELGGWRGPTYLYHLLKRNAPIRSVDLLVTVFALPLLPFAAGSELVAGGCRRGGTIAVRARAA